MVPSSRVVLGDCLAVSRFPRVTAVSIVHLSVPNAFASHSRAAPHPELSFMLHWKPDAASGIRHPAARITREIRSRSTRDAPTAQLTSFMQGSVIADAGHRQRLMSVPCRAFGEAPVARGTVTAVRLPASARMGGVNSRG